MDEEEEEEDGEAASATEKNVSELLELEKYTLQTAQEIVFYRHSKGNDSYAVKSIITTNRKITEAVRRY